MAGSNEEVGQPQVKPILHNILKNKTLSHAYLFHGPAGTGKARNAFAFAQAILCEQQADKACGQCVECRKVEHRNHPNFKVIEPEGTSIKLAQIRQLQKDYSHRSVKDQTKIYLIQQADRMTTEAANSLLKFLEEPPSKMLAILLTENEHAVLPTIRSRSGMVSFTPMNPWQMHDVLVGEKIDAAESRIAVHLSSGLDAARELIEQSWFAEMRAVVIQLGKACLSHGASAHLILYEKVMKGDLAPHIDVLLDMISLWFKDMIHMQYGRTKQLVFADQESWLRKAALSRDTNAWIACMEATLQARKRLRTNMNPIMALEQWLVHI